jgi:hypothetical protein
MQHPCIPAASVSAQHRRCPLPTSAPCVLPQPPRAAPLCSINPGRRAPGLLQLLRRDPDLLAMVMGHETAHALARHNTGDCWVARVQQAREALPLSLRQLAVFAASCGPFPFPLPLPLPLPLPPAQRRWVLV